MSLELIGISHSYRGATSAILTDVNLSVERGESLAVCAPSGFGKSTLLAIAGLLLQPTGGEVRINGQSATTRNAQAFYSTGIISWIGQAPKLMWSRNAVENVAIPALPRGFRLRDAVSRSSDLLAMVGIDPSDGRAVATFSGGEQQRVAVARALYFPPLVLLADEPTANLDRANADDIAALVLGLGSETSVLVATHDPLVASQASRTIMLDSLD